MGQVDIFNREFLLNLFHFDYSLIFLFLKNQQADLGMSPVSLSYDRYEAIEYSGLNGGDGYSILVRYPTPTLSSSSSIDVFSIPVSSLNITKVKCCV